jgi:hypothetical protein
MMQTKETSSTSKKWTWRKPKGKPKRPLSAYNIFFQDVRKQMVEERRCSTENVGSGGLGFRNLARAVAAKWKDLDHTLKVPYDVKARQAMERYKLTLSLWEKTQKCQASNDNQNERMEAINPESLKERESDMPTLISVLRSTRNISDFSRNEARRLTHSNQVELLETNQLNPVQYPSSRLVDSYAKYLEFGTNSDNTTFTHSSKIWNSWNASINRQHAPNNSTFPESFSNLESANILNRGSTLDCADGDSYEPLPLYDATWTRNNDSIETYELPNCVCNSNCNCNDNSMCVLCSASGKVPLSGKAEYQVCENHEAATAAAIDKLLNMLDTDDCDLMLRRLSS